MAVEIGWHGAIAGVFLLAGAFGAVALLLGLWATRHNPSKRTGSLAPRLVAGFLLGFGSIAGLCVWQDLPLAAAFVCGVAAGGAALSAVYFGSMAARAMSALPASLAQRNDNLREETPREADRSNADAASRDASSKTYCPNRDASSTQDFAEPLPSSSDENPSASSPAQ